MIQGKLNNKVDQTFQNYTQREQFICFPPPHLINDPLFKG